jgi:high-affinity Fe2+/Pb2+ permease
MWCSACHVLTLGRTVCPVCGGNFLEFNLRQSRNTKGTRQQSGLGWSIGILGRAVLIAGLFLTLWAVGTENESIRAPGLLASGFLGAIAGMLLVVSGYLLDLIRSHDSLRPITRR